MAEPNAVVMTPAEVVEAMTVLDLIVAEFQSDPMSVQCFDLGTVTRAEKIVKRWRELVR